MKHTKKKAAAKDVSVMSPDEYREHRRMIVRRCNLRRNYGIEVEEYDEMLEAQGGVCAICGGEAHREFFDVDHCHETGRVRGLLCASCNMGLGKFRDDPKILQNAIDYLG